MKKKKNYSTQILNLETFFQNTKNIYNYFVVAILALLLIELLKSKKLTKKLLFYPLRELFHIIILM